MREIHRYGGEIPIWPVVLLSCEPEWRMRAASAYCVQNGEDGLGQRSLLSWWNTCSERFANDGYGRETRTTEQRSRDMLVDYLPVDV